MAKVFWALVAVDAGLFLYLLIVTLKPRYPADGYREMTLFFGVMLPGTLVALAVILYVLSSSTVLRWIALIVVAGPLLFIVVVRARSAYIDYRVRHMTRGEIASPERKP